jgi:predicted transcriptional regulator of viral defense system
MHVIACAIRPGAYVSLQSALSHYGLIPEYVPETTCVTTGRPLLIETPFGRLTYRHVKKEAFWGYAEEQRDSQIAFVAKPEKAFLDLIYLTPGAVDRNYLVELRLQSLEDLDQGLVEEMTERFSSPKLMHVPEILAKLRREAEGGHF